MQISVSFTFDCDDMEEAKQLVATWKVHPGVQLLGLSGTAHAIERPVVVAMGGTIGGHLLATAQRSYAEELPPPVEPAPGGPYDTRGK